MDRKTIKLYEEGCMQKDTVKFQSDRLSPISIFSFGGPQFVSI